MKRWCVGAVVAAALGGLLAAGAPSGLAAHAPDTVTVAQGSDMLTGDPQKVVSTLTYNVLGNIYDGLIDRDRTLRLQPGLAVSWTMVAPTVWEFKLRRGVKFHDGEPFNAAAVKFTIGRALDPKTRWPGAGLLRGIKSVDVVDDLTVRMTTAQPWPLLPSYLAYYGMMLPPQYVAQNGEDALAKHPVGTGPYRFVSWAKDDHVELEANPTYWGGRPKITHAFIRTIPDQASRLAALLSGSVDVINDVPPDDYAVIQRTPRLQLVEASSTGIYYILFNLVNPKGPIADVRVRQALNMAVDRTAIAQGIMHGAVAPATSFCSAVSLGCDTTVLGFPYDPARAKQLLKDAGYPNGFDMTIATMTGQFPADRDTTLNVADQLSKVGVRAKVVTEDYGVLLVDQVEGRKLPYEATWMRVTDFVGYAGGIAERTFTAAGSVSLWATSPDQFAQYLGAADILADPAQAKDLYRKAEMLFLQEAPAIPLVAAPNVDATDKMLVWHPRDDYMLRIAAASWMP